ncbi:RagB/SusD family nutrient uptake outer membrane protein [Mucilaginibacter rubeus]|uniref:RagB/SusD family nutrient uptake outer membrane protein n=1 Tax=Mucilaginibacter rubeus TaxID=2027860 RepID=A0AAE6MIR9_9SPHI|nr:MULTISPECIES: RagB/SusD family nutrient uptake outer membrane protein [Mucilaginibacter]QEM04893.1 RagB/SusD family nutrient uptake outer membrane protein [Mucilaginibacter rubeus]QEM17487.1 RagB/SusD family nutrient uptake outer membrane protein [Mucilaginibacter gossypii]QTE45992.1 RagB/SusD family nutrient uptake outer membrane protein [Mucilaginibacter rubeus]QTE52589.1 RagB/SusD family nutrient uptake outer membrane protein [Mucilaginibacter rubeus]QTE57678.1 RagB/SusD family nutrient 
MENLFYKTLFYTVVYYLLLCSGCKKETDFLNAKPNEALAVPSTLNDLKSLLHNQGILNQHYPALGQISSDDSYVTTSFYNTTTTTERNAYIWAKQIYDPGANVGDWSDSYNQIYYANTVLDALPHLTNSSNQQGLANEIKGVALFYRSFAFYNLVQTFALPYDPSTSKSDLGIPLRLTSNLNVKSVRATVQQSYDQIMNDLQIAATLLPLTNTDQTEPTKASVLGLLSRVKLALGNYTGSLQNATDCLVINNKLQDFNQLNPNAFPIYPNFSMEELFHSSFEGYGLIGFNAVVDSTLFQSFNDPNDLRPSIFFYNSGGIIGFNSQFDKHNNIYCGISINEIYLNKAECEARTGDFKSAMADLNTLLIKRWKTGSFKPFTALNSDSALKQILAERRKELVFTGIRWTDLRRLNKDVRFAVTLTRIIGGKTYTLPPNDPKYALPIPDNEIVLSGIPQNNR